MHLHMHMLVLVLKMANICVDQHSRVAILAFIGNMNTKFFITRFKKSDEHLNTYRVIRTSVVKDTKVPKRLKC